MDSTPQQASLTPLSLALIHAFSQKSVESDEEKITVNRLVSEIASWYEKLRNSMELSDDSVILRNAIERILKRRLLLGGTGDKIAEPLLRELIWARYFPDNSLPERVIHDVSTTIDLYLDLKHKTLEKHRISEIMLNEWILNLLSSHISLTLVPNKERQSMNNFMYHILSQGVEIEDDTEETKNVQVFLAVRRSFAKDDRAFLRYYLFLQLFPDFDRAHLTEVAMAFPKAIAEITRQLEYPLKEKILIRVKRLTPIFTILFDVLEKQHGRITPLLEKPENFAKAVFDACEVRYSEIKARVQRTIVRSIIFLILTKVAFAFAVEGTYDIYAYGSIQMKELIINIIAPPLLMIIASFFIKTPGIENSRKILQKITQVLFEEKPRLLPVLRLRLKRQSKNPLMTTIFAILWLATFGLSFGLIIWGLDKLNFNPVSQVVFIFFITIVSFLAYRIMIIARSYTIEISQGVLTPIVDLLFIPVVKIGMRLTDGISQINPFVLLFDFLIEAPFKTIFGFFEQLFSYLHTKREELE